MAGTREFNLEPNPKPIYPILVNKLAAYFRKLWKKLISLKDTPHAIAGGVAIGMFIGFTPLFGLKTLLALGVAYLLRCNPIAAVVTVSLHDVVTPLWPVILRFEYDIGYWILSSPHGLPPKLEMHHMRLADLLDWRTFLKMLEWPNFLKVGLPLMLGSLFLSVPSAVVSYFGALAFLRGRKAARDPMDDVPPEE